MRLRIPSTFTTAGHIEIFYSHISRFFHFPGYSKAIFFYMSQLLFSLILKNKNGGIYNKFFSICPIQLMIYCTKKKAATQTSRCSSFRYCKIILLFELLLFCDMFPLFRLPWCMLQKFPLLYLHIQLSNC